jgi:hypothetical protein
MSGGGLGDFIFNYFKTYEWQCLPTVKYFFGDAHVLAVLVHHSASVSELVSTNPAIHSIMTYPWFPPGHPKEHLWKSPIRADSIAEWGQKHSLKTAAEHGFEHKVWLTEKEEELVWEIQTGGPFVVMHPFAGMPHRGCKPHPYDGKYKCYPEYKYIDTANYLYDQGLNVVFVGRTTYDGVDALRENTEELQGNSLYPPIYNLINRVSVRVQVELARRANGFLGTHSSMLSAAWTGNTPSVFFYPGFDEHGNHRSVREHGGTTGTWALDKPCNQYYELPSEGFLALNHVDVAHRLMGILR